MLLQLWHSRAAAGVFTCIGWLVCRLGLITALLHLLKWDIFHAGLTLVTYSHYMFLLEQKQIQKKSNQRLCFTSFVKCHVCSLPGEFSIYWCLISLMHLKSCVLAVFSTLTQLFLLVFWVLGVKSQQPTNWKHLNALYRYRNAVNMWDSCGVSAFSPLWWK